MKSLIYFGFDYSQGEESPLWRERDTLDQKLNNLIQDCPDGSFEPEAVRRSNDNPAAALEWTIQDPVTGPSPSLQPFSETKFKEAFRLLRYAILLSTNELLTLSQSDKLLKWSLNHGHFWVIESVIAQHTPTTQLFATKILISAIRLNEDAIYERLLRNGININSHCSAQKGLTLPLYEAIVRLDILAVRLLLEHGADPESYTDGYTDKMRSMLEVCVERLKIGNRRTEIIRLLFEYGAKIHDTVTDFAGDDESGLFHAIVKSGDAEVARLFLKAGTPVDCRSFEDPLPLQLAALHGHAEIVEVLLEFGADVNAPIGDEQENMEPTTVLNDEMQHSFLTPLQIGIANDNFEVVEILLEHSADVNGYITRVSGDIDE